MSCIEEGPAVTVAAVRIRFAEVPPSGIVTGDELNDMPVGGEPKLRDTDPLLVPVQAMVA
jgi:hypothetical protein